MTFKIEEVKENMVNVSPDEITRVHQKVWYVYNNYRNLLEHQKIHRLKKEIESVDKEHVWSVLIVSNVASSIAHDKFFVFYVSCKYYIGVAGLKC